MLVVLTLAVSVSCGGGGGSTSSPPPASNPVPSITSLSPSSATAGTAAQTLTINGANFLSSSTVTYNSVAHTATFVNSAQLTISLSATDQGTAGSYAVVVTNPSPGGGASNSVDFTVNNTVPAITNLSPSSATAGAAAQTLTISGTNFLSTSTITYNGAAHTPTFVSSTQLTITLSTSDQATAGSYAVVVTNPAPGGGASSSVNFTVNNPVPTITSLSPPSATAGAAAQTLTINGTNFLSSSTVTYNSVAHTATFVNSAELTISLSATDQGTGGSYAVVVTNPSPGGGASNSMSFTVNNPVPSITGLSPTSATTGGGAQTLTVNGTGFLATSTVTYKGVAHTPTFVSSTQLTITLSTSDQATAGTYAVAVTSPAPGGGASNSVSFAVNNPVPTITNLSPTSATAGAAAQTLTISGTNFLSTSMVTYNGVPHTPTFVGSTELTISLSTTDQAAKGSYAVVVTNAAPGGGASNSVSFAVNNPVPGITGLSPTSVTAGAAAQTLIINGTNFLSTSTVTYNGVVHTSTFVSAAQLTITLTVSDQATVGSYAVVVTNPLPGGGASNSANFNVNNPVPTITSLSPTTVTTGAAAQTLIINGTNFLPTSTVTYNGVAHTPTFVSSAQLTISLSASDQVTAGIYPVVVSNPAPGGGASNLVNFTVNNPVPTLTGLSPGFTTAGAAAQTLTISGTNFVSNSSVTYNGVPHSATFVSSTQLTISLSATDQATPGAYTVIVTNPSPGGGASDSFPFTVNNPTPACSSEPQSQTVTAPATATFCVTAPPTGSPSYQWYKNGVAIDGATSSSYTTPPTTWGTNGAAFSVTGTDGSVSTPSSTAILTVYPAPTVNLSPVGPVLIGGLPLSQTVVAGTSATFTAAAIGSMPISYQWNENGVPISGATLASYTTPPTTAAEDGETFTVTVTNSVNGFTSVPATLSVVSAAMAPTIAAQPQVPQTSQSNTASFYVFATGTAPLAYQWYENGLPIVGATDSSYTTPPTTSADNNAQFTVTVTNSAGEATSAASTLFVGSSEVGLAGFRLLGTGYPYPFASSDLIGVQYNFQVVTNTDTIGKIIFGFNYLTTPGSTVGGYDIESNVYSASELNFANGACTTYPPLGTFTAGEASLRNATADYPYQAGATSAVGSAINTGDPVNWPVQTYLVDNIPDLWKSDSMSQFNMNGLEALVTIERGGTLTDVSGFERCGLAMLSTTYRMWTITTQVSGQGTVVNQIVVPDAYAQYIVPAQAMQFASEFLAQPGTLTVQYWNLAYMRESNPVWSPAITFMTNWIYDGTGQDMGAHVVTVNGQDRIEISNVPGNSYLPGNLPFAIAPP